MKVSSILVLVVFGFLTFWLWSQLNRTETSQAPLNDWPSLPEGGFAFQPFRANQDATKDEWPSEKEIDEDLAIVAQRVLSIRTYSSRGTLAEIPRLAAKHNLRVALGIYLVPVEGDEEEQARARATNEEEILNGIRVARANKNVIRILVGNETLYHRQFTVTELAAIMARVRIATGKPVSTGEPHNVWLNEHPELVDYVDFLAVHMFPYWEGIPVDQAVDYVVAKKLELHRKFKDKNKRIVIAEVGWPSDGRTRVSAEPSLPNQAYFLRSFLERIRAERERKDLSPEEKEYTYYICEAFDQPWKESTGEGGAGPYWGVYDAYRQPKFPFTDKIEAMPAWDALAAVSVIIAAILLGFFYLYSHRLKTFGRTFLALVVHGIAIVTVWIIYSYWRPYISASSIIVGGFLVLGMLGVVVVILAEALEWAEAHWVIAHRRMLSPAKASNGYSPKVSIHVPAYNEPPDMVIETLNSLAQLDYHDYEVLVIDNNTNDEAVWRPVEAHCLKLGDRFRFFHVAPLPGFKAGALNLALRHTHPDAAIVAVIDSDYKVDAEWLKDLVPAFKDLRMGIVQAPQDYRDEADNAFKAMCYAEYRGFFHIGMITRNERNAIIQHGTMTMVRKKALEEVGGWAEWCITEDAELGLRIFERGYEATYLPRSYGRGVMPDTFIDFKKQRFRWAYGAMQILRQHTRALFTGHGGLSSGQRYHFVAGWLPWIADGFNAMFTVGALVWSALMWMSNLQGKPNWFPTFEPPLLAFSILPLALFTFKLVKLLHLYVTRVGMNLRQTLAAAMAGLALSHTIGLATLKGLVTRNEPFFRTPKQAQPHAFARAFASARIETFLMLALWLSAYAVSVPELQRSPDRTMWRIMLLIQSLPYVAALLVSLASAFPLSAKLLGKRALQRDRTQDARQPT